MTNNVFSKLRDEIKDCFKIEELNSLCFDLQIEYEDLGTTLESKCLELVKYCLRHGKINNLVYRLKELRPHKDWESFNVSFDKIERPSKETSTQEITFSFLKQWKPDGISNGFGADILLKRVLNKEEIIAFIEFLTKEFITYADTEDAPILIRLWSSKTAYLQNQERKFGTEFRQGYLVFYVRNLSGKGVYKGFNETRWMQEKGRFSHLFGTVTKIK